MFSQSYASEPSEPHAHARAHMAHLETHLALGTWLWQLADLIFVIILPFSEQLISGSSPLLLLVFYLVGS
jgi:hypothetical protein